MLNNPNAQAPPIQDKAKLTPMMQNSKNRKVPIRGNSNLFDNHNDLLNSGNKDDDDITKITPLNEILKNKQKIDY